MGGPVRVRCAALWGVCALAFGCPEHPEFVCSEHADCNRGSEGRCETGMCTYADASCESGRRWSSLASERGEGCVVMLSSTGGSGSGDTQQDTTTSPQQTCAEQYGEVPDFVLCEEAATTCAFNARLDARLSCEQMCQTYGGACVNAFSNDPASCELSAGGGDLPPPTCATNEHTDNICVCTRV